MVLQEEEECRRKQEKDAQRKKTQWEARKTSAGEKEEAQDEAGSEHSPVASVFKVTFQCCPDERNKDTHLVGNKMCQGAPQLIQVL